MKSWIVMTWSLLFLISCSGGGSQSPELRIDVSQFRSALNASHTHQFVVRAFDVNGGFETISHFGTHVKEFVIDDLPAGAEVSVLVEGLNHDDQVIYRGLSSAVKIEGGVNSVLDIHVNAVPIFKDLKDGMKVYQGFFKPKVWSAKQIDVEISLLDKGESQTLEKDVALSLATVDGEAFENQWSTLWPLGVVELQVRDQRSGEYSKVSIEVIPFPDEEGLISTAGNTLGSLMPISSGHFQNIQHYFESWSSYFEEKETL